MSDMRTIIREVLREELAALKNAAMPAQRPREEMVTITSDADLNRFVQRILTLSGDGTVRAEFEAGRHVFRLAQGGVGASQFRNPAAPRVSNVHVDFERGLITEKHIVKLDEEARVIRVGKTVCFTPLAKDELRRRGIKIERARS